MKRIFLCTLALAAMSSLAGPSLAQDGVDKTKAAAFDNRMFAGPLGQKTYACFVRRYDANHLVQHPKQKVSAMKLLVTAENPPEERITNYSFRIGVKYRHRPGNFDSSGYCNHVVAEDKGNEIHFGCGVDCDGGGIDIAMKDDKSAIIQLERIRIWRQISHHPAGADQDLGPQQARRRFQQRSGSRRRRQDFPGRPRRSARMCRAGDRPQGTRGAQA
jgi:hypothetical protein